MATTALGAVGKKGEFSRAASRWRNFVSTDPQSKFPAEPNRYHLYVSYACPWANRCLAVRLMKGLDAVIGVSVVHPTWKRTRPDVDNHAGWAFARPGETFTSGHGHGAFTFDDVVPDALNGALFMRDLYEKCGDSEGPFTVPALWDTKTKTIVSNESSEIVLMLNAEFNAYATNPDLNLAPPALDAAMQEAVDWIYPNINNGVYRCGFATTQKAYDEAVTTLFTNLDRLEELLGTQRYVCGGTITLADIFAFMTLVRFDEIYVVYFKTNKKTIAEYPNLLNYCRELYQIPGIGGSVNMTHCKVHYFSSHPSLNTYAIVPAGPDFMGNLKQPHDRARFPQ
eukprot:GEMP01042558.1.p1 GENE.GEMP01042558.1~~GEMP01042558.1.p1  ORF type:complete len:339 (+),score=81.18 GEMP01042558.1:157-1173(+)